MIHKEAPGGPTKTALVTGGARRIGASIVRRLHSAGYNVAVHYRRSAAQAAALTDDLNRARPESALAVQADLCSVSDCRDLAGKVLQNWCRLDAVVNNASAFYPTPLETTTEKDWDAISASNLKGPFFLVQAAAPALREARGSVVNLGDIYAERPLTEHTVYSTAKAGLAALTRGLARDLAPRVRVNAVAPGAILWSENEKNESARRALLETIPLARRGTAREIANTVNFLLSDEAGYITGQVLAVDGGRSVVST